MASSIIHSGRFAGLHRPSGRLIVSRAAASDPSTVSIVSRRKFASRPRSRSRSRSADRLRSPCRRGSRRRSRTASRSGPSTRGNQLLVVGDRRSSARGRGRAATSARDDAPSRRRPRACPRGATRCRDTSRAPSRPLDRRVEILLLDLPVRPQAEVVRQLADVLPSPGVDRVLEQAVARAPCLARFFWSTAATSAWSSSAHLVAGEQRVDDAMDVLRDDAPFLAPVRLARAPSRAADRLEDLLGSGRDLLELARGQRVVADRARCGRARGSSSRPRS